MKHMSRNRSIRNIQIRHDFIMLSYVLYPLHIEAFPTGSFLLGIIFILIFLVNRADNKSSPINNQLLGQIKSVFGELRKIQFCKAPQKKDYSRAYSLGYRTFIYLESKIYSKSKLDKYGRSVVSHELAHAKRNDTFVSFVYENAIVFVVCILISAPITILLSPAELKSHTSSFMVLTYLLISSPPAIYLYLTKKQYEYRREFMADAEALALDPDNYETVLKEAALKERFEEKQDTQIKNEKTFHPPFKERYGYISGKIRTPTYQVFLYCFVVGLFSFYALFSLAKSLIIDPEFSANLPDAAMKIIIGLLLAAIYFFNLAHIVRIVCNVRNTGLESYDKIVGSIGLLLGILPIPIYFGIMFLNKQPQFTPIGTLSVVWVFWVIGIVPIAMIACTSVLFKKIRHTASIFFIGIAVGCVHSYQLQPFVTHTGFIGQNMISLVIVMIILSFIGPIFELFFRLPSMVGVLFSRATKRLT